MLGEVVGEEGGLVDEGEDGGLVGGYEGGVCGSATGGEVVGEDGRAVELGEVVAQPVGSVGGGIAGEGRVAERVREGGFGAGDVEAGLRVAVAAGGVVSVGFRDALLKTYKEMRYFAPVAVEAGADVEVFDEPVVLTAVVELAAEVVNTLVVKVLDAVPGIHWPVCVRTAASPRSR